MEYIKLFWEGAPDGEPSVILYEVDTENERLALRSIDIFADGRTRNIPDLYDGVIEITPIPTATVKAPQQDCSVCIPSPMTENIFRVSSDKFRW